MSEFERQEAAVLRVSWTKCDCNADDNGNRDFNDRDNDPCNDDNAHLFDDHNQNYGEDEDADVNDDNDFAVDSSVCRMHEGQMYY